MSDILVLGAFVSFLIFLLIRKHRKYAALLGWTFMILNLMSEIPSLFREGNFLYPVMALLSLPFLAITAERLIQNDPTILQFSRAAAIATIIYIPFAFIPLLHDTLIAIVVGQAFTLITALGHNPQLFSWDVIAENGFYNQIILGCTGILAIAMLLGVALSAEKLSIRQALTAFLFIVPTIWVLNLFRVSIVFIAVSNTWFGSFPDPRPDAIGDANFFWAHNVFAEALAIVVMLLLAWGLCRIIPGLAGFARELLGVYWDRVRGVGQALQRALSR
ncbi:MAG: archaeosortase A [Methanoregula sp.]|jgi:archaeosortase A (PGF-CTERM-specific)|nr:archaeosortase A [Methanoregula sp.]